MVPVLSEKGGSNPSQVTPALMYLSSPPPPVPRPLPPLSQEIGIDMLTKALDNIQTAPILKSQLRSGLVCQLYI